MRKWLRFPLQPPNEKGLRSSQALKFGAPGRIRTHDPLVRSQVLYPTELRALEAAILAGSPASSKRKNPLGRDVACSGPLLLDRSRIDPAHIACVHLRSRG